MHDLRYNLTNGIIESDKDEIENVSRTIGETLSIYENQQLSKEEMEQIAYYVQVHNPQDGVDGALQFGTSNINPGTVNGEFYMTKGHTHEIENRAEYYFGIQGRGLLLIMDENRNTVVQEVEKNSLHYIPGHTAHRLVNIGDEKLVVGACWNADAGHNYAAITDEGFSIKVYKDSSELGYNLKGENNE